MKPGFLSHFDLTVTDVDRSFYFYDQILGRLGYKRPLKRGSRFSANAATASR